MADSPPSREKRFWPTYLVCRKVSNASAALSRSRTCSCSAGSGRSAGRSTRCWIQRRCVGILDVHVFDADPAAVRIAQHAEDVAQLHRALAGEPADGELAVEIPEGQAVLGDVEVGVAADLKFQRVGVGHQVAAHAVGVDDLHDERALVEVALAVVGDVRRPAHRLVRDAQRGEDVVVEAVFAEQQLVHAAQEFAGLRALDDAVVVGRGQGDGLADGERREGLRGCALEGRGVLHRADADDGALAGHQPRHRMNGADAAGVGQADGGAGEVVGGQLAAARPPDDVLVRDPEAAEIKPLSVS